MLLIDEHMKNSKTYNGNTYKFGITIDDKDYIVKYPKGDDLSVYCEYVASRIISKMGVLVQNVRLGQYNGGIVDVIEDFTSGTDLMLHSFRETKQSSEDTDIGDKEYTYRDVTYLIEKHLKLMEPDKTLALRRFWQMFICDTCLANRDRHWGNWGYLSDGKRYYAAPLYDNGACLFPNVNQAIDAYEENREKFLWERVYVFPASLLMIVRESRNHPGQTRAHRSNYAELYRMENPDPVFAEEREKFCRAVSDDDIFQMAGDVLKDEKIDVAPRIKRFWQEIILLRYACIVKNEKFEEIYAKVERWEGR